MDLPWPSAAVGVAGADTEEDDARLRDRPERCWAPGARHGCGHTDSGRTRVGRRGMSSSSTGSRSSRSRRDVGIAGGAGRAPALWAEMDETGRARRLRRRVCVRRRYDALGLPATSASAAGRRGWWHGSATGGAAERPGWTAGAHGRPRRGPVANCCRQVVASATEGLAARAPSVRRPPLLAAVDDDDRDSIRSIHSSISCRNICSRRGTRR